MREAADAPGFSVHVVDADTGAALLSTRPDVVRPTASVAKVLVLSALARALESGDVTGDEVLSRASTPRVADSGLWHLLDVDALPVSDVAVLVAAVSDNWATNVLVERLGLATVDHGLGSTRLLDLVRDERSPEHAPTLSVGTAREWAGVMASLHRREWVSPAVSDRVLGWLATGVDHSLVLSAFARDPLVVDHAVLGKTGADASVRCDVGLVTGPVRTAAYACLGDGDPADLVPRLREVGAAVRTLTEG